MEFVKFMLVNKMSTGQIALWYAIDAIRKMQDDTEWFKAPYDLLMRLTGLSRRGIIKARKALLELELIEIKYINKNAVMYRMCPLSAAENCSMRTGADENDNRSKGTGADESSALCMTDSAHLYDKNELCTADSAHLYDKNELCMADSAHLVREEKEKRTKKEKEENIYNNINNNIRARDVFCCFEENIGIVSPFVLEGIEQFRTGGISDDMICEAIKDAALNNKRSWRYIERILIDKESRGIKTAEGYRRERNEWQERKNGSRYKEECVQVASHRSPCDINLTEVFEDVPEWAKVGYGDE